MSAKTQLRYNVSLEKIESRSWKGYIARPYANILTYGDN